MGRTYFVAKENLRFYYGGDAIEIPKGKVGIDLVFATFPESDRLNMAIAAKRQFQSEDGKNERLDLVAE